MPAQVADIARAMRAATIVEAENAAIKAVYVQARDARTAPAKGYFDDAGDAQDAMDDRIAIVGVIRRRFAVTVDGLVFPDLSGGVPVWRLADPEQDIAGDKVMTARIELDAENETTAMEMFG